MCLKPNKRNSLGFTLLEMLVAIAIFAIIGLAANSTLHVVLKNKDATEDFSKRLKGLQQGFGMMDRDLGQIVARTPRVLSGRGGSVIQYGAVIPNIDGQALIFYRLGWLNPDGMLPRGSIQSVAYVFTDDKLERWYFPYPDPVIGTEPVKTTIIDNVLEMDVRFFDGQQWQKVLFGKGLPKAIAIKLDVEGIGKVERKFLLAADKVSSSAANKNGAGI